MTSVVARQLPFQRSALSSAPPNRDSVRSKAQVVSESAQGSKEKQRPTQQRQGARGGKLTQEYGVPPEVITRPEGSGGPLRRLELLGEGGFARVYRVREPDGTYKALKVIAKAQLKNEKNKAKLFAEIKLHQSLNHPNIVRFEGCFEDEANVYMQMELCINGSLLDLLRRRRVYTEAETRFYLLQLIAACDYMHSHCVIHRDLKLGNLFLDSDMNLRVGDFGLAALVKGPGDRKKTICGTPNYIAPEILFDTNNGHSFEVDIWSVGVILYTLLVGRPPFQMKEVKEIYNRIKENKYSYPEGAEPSDQAQDLIASILMRKPEARPALEEIMTHPFFYCGPFPPRIPSGAVGGVPDFSCISQRESQKNFKALQRYCWVGAEMGYGIEREGIELEIRKKRLDTVTEEKEPVEVELKEIGRMDDIGQERERRIGTVTAKIVKENAQEAQSMEQEVRHALQTEAPISDLLRTARQPLMVSPQSSHVRQGIDLPKKVTRLQLTSHATTTQDNKGSLPSRVRKTSQPSTAAPHLGTTDLKKSGSIRSRNGPISARTVVDEFGKQELATHKPGTTTGATGTTTGSRRALSRSTATQAISTAATMAASTRETAVRIRTQSSAGLPPSTEGKNYIETPLSAGGDLGQQTLSSKELYENMWRNLSITLDAATPEDAAAIPDPVELITPKVFVHCWVDYTHKYGTAYYLTDGSAGLYFNDSTTMVLAPGKETLDYVSNRKGNIYSRRNYDAKDPPKDLARKAFLLNYFDDYMTHELTRGDSWAFVDENRTKDMDFLVKYYRMKAAIVFRLSNDVIQFNFFDHSKFLLSDNGKIVTIIDCDRKIVNMSLRRISRNMVKKLDGGDPDLVAKHQSRMEFLRTKLGYCRDVLKGLAEKKTAIVISDDESPN